MAVIIGVDPHKATHTAVAISSGEEELARKKVRSGVGPILAGMLIGYTGDITRFRNRDHYAAYNGTAPVEFSSGGRVVHRVSERGNRRLNHAIHMTVICQLRQPHSDGRAYFDRRVAQGKTTRDALRALKRHLSNAVYRQLLADARRSRK
jgi:transposase